MVGKNFAEAECAAIRLCLGSSNRRSLVSRQERIFHNERHARLIKNNNENELSMEQNKEIIGIDLGGTNTCIGLVGDDGTIIETLRFKTFDYPLIEDFIEKVSEQVVFLAEKSNLSKDNIRIGIGAPNGNYYNGSIELAPNLPFKGIVPLKDLLEENLKTKSYKVTKYLLILSAS